MNFESEPPSREELSLFFLVGEAICAVQHVEDALSHSIAYKNVVKAPYRIPKSEADKDLTKYRSFTLGRAVLLAIKGNLYPKQLLGELEKFLLERNWLVHKSIAQTRDEGDSKLFSDTLLRRIKEITIQGQKLQRSIEEDMMNFAEANGTDMSRVSAEIKKLYAEE